MDDFGYNDCTLSELNGDFTTSKPARYGLRHNVGEKVYITTDIHNGIYKCKFGIIRAYFDMVFKYCYLITIIDNKTDLDSDYIANFAFYDYMLTPCDFYDYY